jgi:hypothetical protein
MIFITSLCAMKSALLPSSIALCLLAAPASGLPAPEDIPEEVLRTEIITEGRSPFDGKPLTAAEYAELEATIQRDPPNPQVNPKVEDLVYLIRLRKLFRSIGIPIK